MLKINLKEDTQQKPRKESFLIQNDTLSPFMPTDVSRVGVLRLFHSIQFTDQLCLTFMSAKEWSMWELVEYILKKTGPAKMHFSTFTISEFSARKIVQWMELGMVSEVKGITDSRSKTAHASAFHLCTSQFAAMKSYPCHAKVTVLQNEKFNISINASSNWTENPRIESGTIINNKAIADKHIAWINDIIYNKDEID